MGESILVVFVVVSIFVLIGIVIALWGKSEEANRQIEYLSKGLRDKPGNILFDWESEQRKEIMVQVNAIKDYLGVDFVRTEPEAKMIKQRKLRGKK